MKFASQPVNIEGGGGAALRVSVTLTEAPLQAAGASFALWAARLSDPLSVVTLTALACGKFDLSAASYRQDGPMSGLRQAGAMSVSYGQQTSAQVVVVLEGSLFSPKTDMALRTDTSRSWDTLSQPLKERADGPWLIAATACLPDGTVVIAQGGLSQWPGQEHLAGVHLGPSNLAPQVEVGYWLENTIRSLKPILDFRMAQVAWPGQDLSLKSVRFTGEQKGDEWPALYITPDRETDGADGLAAPDRRDLKPSFTIRAVAYGDDPAAKSRGLSQLIGSLKQILNTRKLREGVLPSGLRFNLAFATEMEFGQTEDGWDDAADLTWSCTLIQTGAF